MRYQAVRSRASGHHGALTYLLGGGQRPPPGGGEGAAMNELFLEYLPILIFLHAGGLPW